MQKRRNVSLVTNSAIVRSTLEGDRAIAMRTGQVVCVVTVQRAVQSTPRDLRAGTPPATRSVCVGDVGVQRVPVGFLVAAILVAIQICGKS